MLSKFSVKKPFTVVVAVIMILLLGGISFTKMTTDLLPSLNLPYVIVMTTYPGASPEKVETGVTKPLEKTLATTSGIKNINSISSENSSVIILEFEQATNMDSVMIELSGKIDLVKAYFEDGVSSPTLMKLNPNMMPIMIASVDVNDMGIKEVSKYVQDEVVPEFERIDGVASVDATGLVKEEVHVNINQQKIDELNNKVLASVDAKLAETKLKLDDAKEKLEAGKKELEAQSQKQTQNIVNAGVELTSGKNQMQIALSNFPSLISQINQKKESLVKQRDIIQKVVDKQNELNLPTLDKENEILNQLNMGIKACDDSISQMKDKQKDLENKLAQVVESEKQLETGKLTLSQELTKASVKLENSETELNKGIEEFEKARDEAYAKANISSMITSDTISAILMADNFSMPAGYIKEGEEQFLVKVGDKFSDLEELKNLVLFNVDIGEIGEIKLTDVAEVEMADNSNEIYAKINGNDGIILSMQKQSTASTSEVSDKINEEMEKLMKENSNLHITALNDQGTYIDIVINSVLNNLISGGILAIIILFIFLKNIRPTIIIAFSIPISLMFALVAMYFSGVTMNVISLAGLALGVGMLVDNSIVVIENIYRLRNEGMSAAKAAVEGAKQVSGAIFASTLTTICVFLPIVFAEGISRQLFTDMGLTIAYSLLASLIVALTLVPTMGASILKKNEEKEHKLFDKFVNVYGNILNKALKYKFIVLAIAIGLLAFSAFKAVNMGTAFIPSMDSPQMSITLEMDKDTKNNELREMSNTVIDKITEIDDIETIGALQSGGSMSMLTGGGNSNSISMYVLLKQDKKLNNEEIKKMIEEKTKDLNCELSISASTMDMSSLGGSGIQIKIKGSDLDELQRISKDVANILEKTEGTIDVSNGLEENTTETRVIVDKNKLGSYGLTVAQVYQAVTKAIKNENTSTTLNIGVEDYPVVVIKDKENSVTRDNLKNYKVKGTKNGEEVEVALSEIANISEEESLNSITHMAQTRTISVSAGIDDDHNIGFVSREVEKELDKYNVPEGYNIEIAGENETINETMGDLILMITLAIVFIYLIMVAQFQSLLSPFIVLFTIPLAFTGGLLALVITGFELSIISMLGFLVLSGIIVNNGIVFVDYVNQLRLEGMDKHEALIKAGKTRIRPILMTALTTILGLSTMALGIGMGSDMVQPMAIVTIGGLVYGTILTLFVVPIIYDLLHRKDMKVINIEE